MDKEIDFNKLKNVLIRGTNWIGDVAMTFPAIAAVRQTLPKARITVLVKPWVADLVRMHPAVDDVLVYERPGRHDGLRGLFALAREIRQRRFDAAILLQNAFEAAVIARLAGIPVRAGYSTDGRGPLLTHPVKLGPAMKTVHQSLYYLGMLESLGFASEGTGVSLVPSEAQRQAAQEHLERLGIAGRRPLVGMAPGAAYGPAKRWFPERFAAVADRLAGRYACPVLLFGSSGDRASTEAVQSAAKSALADVAGRTTLSDAIALIACCDLFVTNDSGLMHVSGALGVPTVAIFGSTNPETTYPLGKRTVLIRRPVDCSPCLRKVCPTDFRCMDLVTVDEVVDESMRLLADSGYR
jgi:heptosyltransferase-2